MAAQITDGWFTEKEEEALWPGQRFSLKLAPGNKVLHTEKSDYQDIVVFDTATYGRCLVLDGAIQVTTRDEFAYQEMIAHVPLFAHPNPKAVLIVGGGDGGVAREVCKHPGLEKVVMCEIDAKVCDVAKRFFGTTTATALLNPPSNFTLLYMDAALYMKEHKAEFDVIIVDSSDPVGPAESLYTSEFYLNMHAALRPGGIVCTQGECQWSNLSLIKKVMGDAAQIYPTVDYAYTCIPTYPSGQIGFILANKGGSGKANMRAPRAIPASMTSSLRYYNSTIHAASFVLPNFAADELVSVRAPNSSSGAPSSTTTLALSLVTGVAVGAMVAAAVLTKRK